jgi:signal peptidase I
MPDKNYIRFYRGNSMKGIFRLGDCLFVESVSIDEIRLGDIVVYRGLNGQGEERELVHRVIGKSSKGLITRGDNNPSVDDTPVTSNNQESFLVFGIHLLKKSILKLRRVY